MLDRAQPGGAICRMLVHTPRWVISTPAGVQVDRRCTAGRRRRRCPASPACSARHRVGDGVHATIVRGRRSRAAHRRKAWTDSARVRRGQQGPSGRHRSIPHRGALRWYGQFGLRTAGPRCRPPRWPRRTRRRSPPCGAQMAIRSPGRRSAAAARPPPEPGRRAGPQVRSIARPSRFVGVVQVR